MSKGLFRSGVLGAVIKFGGVGLGFLYFLAVARATSAAEYGIFGSAFSLATIIGFSATAGQSVAALRFWPGISSTQGTVAADAYLRLPLVLVAANLLAIAVIAVVVTVFAPDILLNLGVAGLAWPIALMSVAFTLSEFFVASIRARERLIFAMAPREIVWRVLTIAVLIALPGPLTGGDAIVTSAVCLIAATAPQIFVTIVKLWAARHQPVPHDIRAEHRTATWGLWGVAIAMPMTQHFATVIVALTLGPVAAGAYFAADRLAKLLTIPTFGINQIAAPELAKAFRSADTRTMNAVARSASNFSFIFSALGLVCFVLIGRLALAVFNAEFVHAYDVLLILAFGQLIVSVGGANEMLLQIAKQERIYLAVVLCWGVGGLALAGLFALNFGLIGAAIATTFGLAGRAIHTIWLCKSRLHISTIPGIAIREPT